MPGNNDYQAWFFEAEARRERERRAHVPSHSHTPAPAAESMGNKDYMAWYYEAEARREGRTHVPSQAPQSRYHDEPERRPAADSYSVREERPEPRRPAADSYNVREERPEPRDAEPRRARGGGGQPDHFYSDLDDAWMHAQGHRPPREYYNSGSRPGGGGSGYRENYYEPEPRGYGYNPRAQGSYRPGGNGTFGQVPDPFAGYRDVPPRETYPSSNRGHTSRPSDSWSWQPPREPSSSSNREHSSRPSYSYEQREPRPQHTNHSGSHSGPYTNQPEDPGSKAPSVDPYTTLKVSRSVSQADLRKAWIKLSREHHPDQQRMGADKKKATERMAVINNAYDILKDPKKREYFDRTGLVQP